MESEKQEHIRKRAYKIWEEKGRPSGSADDHWHQARQEIEAEHTPGAKKPAGSAKKPAAPRKSAAAKTASPSKPAAKAAGAKPKVPSNSKNSKA